MYILEENQALFSEGIVLSTNKLIPSKVCVDDYDDYLFTADLYATIDSLDEKCGYLHFRVSDGTSDDFDPSFSYENKKISEIILQFDLIGGAEDGSFFFKTDCVNIVFLNGEKQAIKTPTKLNGLPLIFASKIFFIDIVRILKNSENCSYSLID